MFRYAFTTELRDTGVHGFVLPKDQIIPSGEVRHTMCTLVANCTWWVSYKYDVYDCVLHRRCGPASRWSSTRSCLTFKRARSHNSSGNFNENKVDDNLCNSSKTHCIYMVSFVLFIKLAKLGDYDPQLHFGKKDIFVHSESFLLLPPAAGDASNEDSVLDLARICSTRPRSGSLLTSVCKLIPENAECCGLITRLSKLELLRSSSNLPPKDCRASCRDLIRARFNEMFRNIRKIYRYSEKYFSCNLCVQKRSVQGRLDFWEDPDSEADAPSVDYK